MRTSKEATGPTRLSSHSLALVMLLALETCGDSHISAWETAVVSFFSDAPLNSSLTSTHLPIHSQLSFQEPSWYLISSFFLSVACHFSTWNLSLDNSPLSALCQSGKWVHYSKVKLVTVVTGLKSTMDESQSFWLTPGIGWGMIVVSAVVTIYYNIFISWSLYFLGKSFAKVVPWATCDNWWNTEDCYDRTLNNNETLLDAIRSVNESWYNFTSQHGAAAILTQELIKQRKTPAEEFWQWVWHFLIQSSLIIIPDSSGYILLFRFNVLELSEGIHEIGGIRWQMLLCLIAAWFLIFFSICKGVKSLGKVVYVTATAPYVFLTILLIRGCLLPGAVDGILFYIKPDFSRLLEFKVRKVPSPESSVSYVELS